MKGNPRNGFNVISPAVPQEKKKKKNYSLDPEKRSRLHKPLSSQDGLPLVEIKKDPTRSIPGILKMI